MKTVLGQELKNYILECNISLKNIAEWFNVSEAYLLDLFEQDLPQDLYDNLILKIGELFLIRKLDKAEEINKINVELRVKQQAINIAQEKEINKLKQQVFRLMEARISYYDEQVLELELELTEVKKENKELKIKLSKKWIFPILSLFKKSEK